MGPTLLATKHRPRREQVTDSDPKPIRVPSTPAFARSIGAASRVGSGNAKVSRSRLSPVSLGWHPPGEHPRKQSWSFLAMSRVTRACRAMPKPILTAVLCQVRRAIAVTISGRQVSRYSLPAHLLLRLLSLFNLCSFSEWYVGFVFGSAQSPSYLLLAHSFLRSLTSSIYHICSIRMLNIPSRAQLLFIVVTMG
jgi:hypothetical protein